MVGLTLLWGLRVLKSAWVLGRVTWERVLPVSSWALGPNFKWTQTRVSRDRACLCRDGAWWKLWEELQLQMM